MSIYLFSEDELPRGFRFPAAYIAAVNADAEATSLEPWWYLCLRGETARYWLVTLKKQYPKRTLVPFAKIEHTDDIACFDGAATSGNPRVIYVHAFASPGWEDRGEVANFDAWLLEAAEHAKEHAEQQEEFERGE